MALGVAALLLGAMAQRVYPRERCLRADNCYIIVQGGTKVCYFIRDGRGSGYDCYHPVPQDMDINLIPEFRLGGSATAAPLTFAISNAIEDTPYPLSGPALVQISDADADAQEMTLGISGVMTLTLSASLGTISFSNASGLSPPLRVVGVDGPLPSNVPPAVWPHEVWFSGATQGFSSTTLRARQAEINLLIADMVFTPNPDVFTRPNIPTTYYSSTTNEGSRSLSDAQIVLHVDDNGHTGLVAETADLTISIGIIGVNDLPTITVSPTAPSTVAEDTTLAFAAGNFVAADVDNVPATSTGAALRLRIQAPAGSTVTSVGGQGLSSSTDINGMVLGGDDNLICTLPICAPMNSNQVTALLNGLRFRPPPNFHGNATLAVTLWDISQSTLTLGVYNDPSVPQTTLNFVVAVTAVNDAPVLALGASSTHWEGIPGVISGLAFSDIDAVDSTGPYTVTLAPTVAGAVVAMSCGPSPCSLGGGSVTWSGAGTSLAPLTLSGGYAAMQAALNGSVVFTSASNWYTGKGGGAESLAIQVTDGGTPALSVSGTLPLVVHAVNNPPVVLFNSAVASSLYCQAMATTTSTALLFSAGAGRNVTVYDVDFDGTDPTRVMQMLVSSDVGKYSWGSAAGLTFSVPLNYTAAASLDAFLFTGTPVDINTALQTLTWTAPSLAGTARLYFSVNDLGIYGEGIYAMSNPATFCINMNVS